MLKSQLYEIEFNKRLNKRADIEAGKWKNRMGSQIHLMHPYKLVKTSVQDVESRTWKAL